jgi:hypothetical protein
MQTISIFKFSKALCLMGLALAGIAMAQTTPSNPAVSQSDAAVPPVVYRSVFSTTSLGVEKDTVDWRKANDEVGRFTRGHVDILKWEEMNAPKQMQDSAQPMAEPTPKPTPATPAMPAHKH